MGIFLILGQNLKLSFVVCAKANVVRSDLERMV